MLAGWCFMLFLAQNCSSCSTIMKADVTECYHVGSPMAALSWRLPSPWHCHGGHHDCDTVMETATIVWDCHNHCSITDAAENTNLSQRLPEMWCCPQGWQTWCYHQGCRKCSAITKSTTKMVLSPRLLQMQCYNQGCFKSHAIIRKPLQLQYSYEGFGDHKCWQNNNYMQWCFYLFVTSLTVVLSYYITHPW